MAAYSHRPLSCFAEWIQATDEHASSRRDLIERADAILAGEQPAPREERLRLADRLERWRYQHLARRAGSLQSEDWRLLDALDGTANQLAGRDPRSPRAVRTALACGACDHGLAEALQCLDPAVDPAIVAGRAAAVTRERFAACEPDLASSTPRWRMLLYAPLYLSSYCINHCVYCGFRHPNPVERRHLSLRRAVREAEVLIGRGFRHILLVAGDFPRLTTTEYFAEVLQELRARDVSPAIEIAPQSTASYAALVEAGACTLTLYQETYQEDLYALYHPRGSKASFDWRLEGHERAAEAGMRRLGLGILLGLADPRDDLIAMMRHARYLMDRFPDRTFAFSLPRIHDAPAGFRAPFPVDDEAFVRMYCALRIAFPAAELVLSTRERPALRDRLARICITQMSAGSCTAPGGYEDSGDAVHAGEQFPVCDGRTPAEVAARLESDGFEVAWRTA